MYGSARPLTSNGCVDYAAQARSIDWQGDIEHESRVT